MKFLPEHYVEAASERIEVGERSPFLWTAGACTTPIFAAFIK